GELVAKGTPTGIKAAQGGHLIELITDHPQQAANLLNSLDIALALIVGYTVFGVPVRGSLLLICSAGMLCVFAGIGIGTFLATFSRSQQQAQLMGFFINLPLSMLSGATTPIEGMPAWMQ